MVKFNIINHTTNIKSYETNTESDKITSDTNITENFNNQQENNNSPLMEILLDIKNKMQYSFSDEEIIELSKNFKNLNSMIFAKNDKLLLHCRHQEVINFIEYVQQFLKLILKDRFSTDKVLKKIPEMIEYLQLKIGGSSCEYFVVIYLNAQEKIIFHEENSYGFSGKVIIDSRKIISKCIQLSADSIILAHNHPSGNTEPSKDDIELTNKLLELLNAIGVGILDHIIISQDSHFSFKKNFLM